MTETRHIVYIDFESNGNSVPLECDEIIPQETGHLSGFIKLTNVRGVSDKVAPHISIEDFYIKSSHISHIAKGWVDIDGDLDDYSEEDEYSSEEEPIVIANPDKKKRKSNKK